jgi:hypothetical protein
LYLAEQEMACIQRIQDAYSLQPRQKCIMLRHVAYRE